MLDVFKPWLVEGAKFSGIYEIPELKRSNAIPSAAISFDKALTIKNHNQWVHFYIDDYKFERIWRRPKDYLARLKNFQGVITPDFSLYRDLPLAMQIWNTYRNRAVGYFLQLNGIEVIPNIRWGDERAYDFCFEGVEKRGTVAVSSNGSLRDKTEREYFKRGLDEMVKRLEPDVIVNYCSAPEDIFGQYEKAGIKIVSIPHYMAAFKKGAV
jgi:hypothetical protein